MFYLTIGERDNEALNDVGIQCRVNGQTVHRFCSATRSITRRIAGLYFVGIDYSRGRRRHFRGNVLSR